MALEPCLSDNELDELNGAVDLVHNRRLNKAEGARWQVYRVGQIIRVDIEPIAKAPRA